MKYPEDFDDIVFDNREDFAKLDKKTQVGLCIHMLEAQINNGGFDQYFFNSSGLFVQETVEALELIGAAKTKKLLADAIALSFPDGYPVDPTTHRQAMVDDESVFDALDELDQKFYAYEEPLYSLVNAFLDGG
ncbi:MAG: DMP19 family protein [Chloroflexota bacterium]